MPWSTLFPYKAEMTPAAFAGPGRKIRSFRRAACRTGWIPRKIPPRV